MKTLMGGLTLAAMLCCMPATQAEIVIDDFSIDVAVNYDSDDAVPTSVLGQAIGGGVTRSISLIGPEASGKGGGFGIDSNSLSAAFAVDDGFTLSYAFGGAPGLFVDRVLRTGFVSSVISGTESWDLSITTTSSGTTPGNYSATVSSLSDGYNLPDLFSSPGGNGHLASLEAVETLTITAINRSTGFVPTTILNSTSGISAVPEPTSMALLGLTGLGGVVVVRRRRKSAEA